MLVHIASMDNAYELVHTALASVDVEDERIQIVLLRTLHSANDHLLAGPVDGSAVDRAERSLRPLAQFVEGSGASAVILAVQTTDVARAVIDVASERDVEAVVLSSRRPFSPSALGQGTIGRVLTDVHCDVLVLIDPVGRGASPPPRGNVVVPFGDPEGRTMRTARHIARTHGASLRLVGTASVQEAATRMAARHAGASGGIAFTEMATDETPRRPPRRRHGRRPRGAAAGRRGAGGGGGQPHVVDHARARHPRPGPAAGRARRRRRRRGRRPGGGDDPLGLEHGPAPPLQLGGEGFCRHRRAA